VESIESPTQAKRQNAERNVEKTGYWADERRMEELRASDFQSDDWDTSGLHSAFNLHFMMTGTSWKRRLEMAM
jgi:hypothetical protein